MYFQFSQFEKERHTLLCILKLFTDIIHEFLIKSDLDKHLSKKINDSKIT